MLVFILLFLILLYNFSVTILYLKHRKFSFWRVVFYMVFGILIEIYKNFRSALRWE